MATINKGIILQVCACRHGRGQHDRYGCFGAPGCKCEDFRLHNLEGIDPVVFDYLRALRARQSDNPKPPPERRRVCVCGHIEANHNDAFINENMTPVCLGCRAPVDTEHGAGCELAGRCWVCGCEQYRTDNEFGKTGHLVREGVPWHDEAPPVTVVTLYDQETAPDLPEAPAIEIHVRFDARPGRAVLTTFQIDGRDRGRVILPAGPWQEFVGLLRAANLYRYNHARFVLHGEHDALERLLGAAEAPEPSPGA